MPTLANQALAAIDRANFHFTRLQMAQTPADDPQRTTPELIAERTAAGVDEDSLDALPTRSTRLEPGRHSMPEVSTLCERLSGELTAMLAPWRSSSVEDAESFSDRLAALHAEP